MPKKLEELPRQRVWVDKRGRLTIPEYLRKAAKIEGESYIEVVAEPSLKNCKGLLLIKD